MEAEIIEPAIKACLAEIHAKLKAAEQITRAAQACAEAGGVAEAIRVSMDIEQLIYEAGRLHDAATLLARMTHDVKV
ncbi:hypothetical protein GA0061099_1007243 [Bradyrhizobium yuanmingense]|uniref:Uncharacterized protein n=1 Tax=Bradyrhizobium yuanmingense TaxID=108015 RepID=A0A1C3WTV3_9BRAD|nr:hypothetical protein [Bradyrhizobium yuanmingense]TWI23417.1 hypothetical protein IQ15_05001 [Bradyrhizobium yuanmingense]SCB43296.1 hypothetical protein GA0061099_1007243 [Bradyrhizobium yuanmingense]